MGRYNTSNHLRQITFTSTITDMNTLKLIIYVFLAFCVPTSSFAYEIIPFNNGWKFHRGMQAPEHEIKQVSLPHSWNTEDAMFGNKYYYRGLGTYINTIPSFIIHEGKRVFLKVNAAQTVADIFIDNHFVMQHKGGYTAFVSELTDYLHPGKDSKIEIRVNNARTMDIAPICGDFNIFGGLTREVELIVTDDICITPDFYASPGVFFKQRNVSNQNASIDVTVMISNRDSLLLNDCDVDIILMDGDRKVCETSKKFNTSTKEVVATLNVNSPKLWDGINSPFMYNGVVILHRNGIEIDRREVPVGLRYYHIDKNSGFYLNGHPYRLNGVNRHQDISERGAAMTQDDELSDVELIREMGCNAVRTSHYPQSQFFVDQMDKYGLITWIEIPFVNVYVNNPEYDRNLEQQLTEMIMQYYNHPSIVAWGLFNEINSGWLDRPSDMTRRLVEQAHTLDNTRPTMGASNQDDDFNGFTDIIAFNKYFGWYDGVPKQMGVWLDDEHIKHPERKIGISEYGAGGSIYHQSDSLAKPNPGGYWHPENWQTYYHIETYRQLAQRDYLWCNFIWCMFDFTAAERNEGDTPGRNDKGLVTYDRKERKDAFYFYKANWNKSDIFVHIAGKRLHSVDRQLDITAFTNDGVAELFINGKSFGKAIPDCVNVVKWNSIPLVNGMNTVEVKTRHASDLYTFEMTGISKHQQE